MNEKQRPENQSELFPILSGEPRPPDPIPMITKTQKPIFFSTTLEQLLLAGIVLILLLCFVFFLGVLRGRSMGSTILLKPVAALAPGAPLAAPILAAPGRLPTPRTVTTKKESSFVVVNESLVKPYTIQVLTTKKKDYAEEEASSLRKKGANAWAAKSGDFYVVCAGSYANKEGAKKDLLYFRANYKSAYLRRR